MKSLSKRISTQKGMITPSIFNKIMLCVMIVLGVLAYKSHRDVQDSELRLSKIISEKEYVDRKALGLEKQVNLLSKHIKEADDATYRLTAQLKELESKKSKYKEELKELGLQNENVQDLLNTRIPDDLQRVLLNPLHQQAGGTSKGNN